VSCREKVPTENTPGKSEKKVKAGFIYDGPVRDWGWTHAHEVARKKVMKKFPWFESISVENIPAGDAERFIDRLLLEEKCDVIFTTSLSYMDATINAAKKYPNKIFMNCGGYKSAQNVGTYSVDIYQMFYLNGLMGGALTKSNKLGYVAACSAAEVVRQINAFALGVREVNPEAKIFVKWLHSWYDPANARKAAESLIVEGCDVLAFTEDSTSTVEVAEEATARGRPVYTFSHYSPMQKFGPNSVVSGQLVDWAVMYEYILSRIYKDTWTNEDLWWTAKEQAAILGSNFEHPINPKFVEELKKITVSIAEGKTNVYDLVMTRLEQMKKGSFEPFTGPLTDQAGTVRVPSGKVAVRELRRTMNWFIDNVVGSVPE